MSIFIDQSTRVLIQGVTGKEGSYWTKHMKEMGTRITAGVTPGKEIKQGRVVKLSCEAVKRDIKIIIESQYKTFPV